MTPDEYRKKHKRCATCQYFTRKPFENCLGQTVDTWGTCEVKGAEMHISGGRFCRCYTPKPYKGA